MSYATIDKTRQPHFTDKDWVRSIFMINSETLDGPSMSIRTWSTADTKFTDTALGGSLVINPLSQPNLFTDPVSSTHWLKKANANNDALSPYYSEAFDDNYRTVTMRFGTLAFTSLTGFLFNMYHPGAASMINKGLVHQFLFSIGRIIGSAVALITWPVRFGMFVADGVRFALRKPSSRYAYLKPNMPLYWSSVQTIVNHFLVDLGLVFRRANIDTGMNNDDLYPSENQIQTMKQMWPNIYGGKTSIGQDFIHGALRTLGLNDNQGQVDVFAVATRAQRLAQARYQVLEDINDSAGGYLDVEELLQQAYKEGRGFKGQTISEYLKSWTEDGESMYSADRPSEEGRNEDQEVGDSPRKNNLDNDGFWKFLKAELRDGGAYVTFRVDETGPVSETFSNSYKTSQLMEKINSTAASSRSTYFDFAGGNIGDGVVSDLLESIVGGIKSVAEGILTGVGLEGLLIAGGGGTVSMPKYWESSEANLPRANYSFTLKARYAHRQAAFSDVYFPLACILAAALPVSVGKHSHSNPLYCEYYDKGRMQSRLAAIESLTISRGEGNMGFTPDGHLMSVNVSFNLIPMEETIAMPITEGFELTDTLFSVLGGSLIGGLAGAAGGGLLQFTTNMTKGLFDDDTPFMDYMATLAGLGVNEQYYLGSRLKRRLSFKQLNYASTYSHARTAALAADSMPGRVISALFFGERAER